MRVMAFIITQTITAIQNYRNSAALLNRRHAGLAVGCTPPFHIHAQPDQRIDAIFRRRVGREQIVHAAPA